MEASSTRALDEPIADDGIRWLNFFNGRILSAEDLRVDHAAIGDARAQLGRAIGEGVVAGMRVLDAPASSVRLPVVLVTPGLAFNGEGRALELHREVTIGLVRVDAPTDEEGATFETCDVVLAATAGLGAYVLTVEGADIDQGKAPVAGLGNVDAACRTAFSVEGVRFRLYPVDVGADEVDDLDLRNKLAYRMFGQTDRRRLMLTDDPFGARDVSYGGLDDLESACFNGSGVALALLFWRPGMGLDFIDMWSVRRRPTVLSPATTHATPLRDRGCAEGEARFLQFEDHIGELFRREASPADVVATTRFDYLPPAGVLPLVAAKSYEKFFEGLTVRGPAFIEGAHLASLLSQSLSYPAIELARKEVIWLYLVRENAQRPRILPRPGGIRGVPFPSQQYRFALGSEIDLVRRASDVGELIASGVTAPTEDASFDTESLASCLVFTSGHMPYVADARFNLAYWNFANFAEIG